MQVKVLKQNKQFLKLQKELEKELIEIKDSLTTEDKLNKVVCKLEENEELDDKFYSMCKTFMAKYKFKIQKIKYMYFLQF